MEGDHPLVVKSTRWLHWPSSFCMKLTKLTWIFNLSKKKTTFTHAHTLKKDIYALWGSSKNCWEPSAHSVRYQSDIHPTVHWPRFVTHFLPVIQVQLQRSWPPLARRAVVRRNLTGSPPEMQVKAGGRCKPLQPMLWPRILQTCRGWMGLIEYIYTIYIYVIVDKAVWKGERGWDLFNILGQSQGNV